jgi:hypothetical protein
MEEEEVDLVQSESAVARIKGAQRLVIAVIAVPELRGDEYLFTPHQSRGECASAPPA